MIKSGKLKYLVPTFIILIFSLIGSPIVLNAQGTIEIGIKEQPSIETDFSVLDALPLELTLPELLFRQGTTRTKRRKNSTISHRITKPRFIKMGKISRVLSKTNKRTKNITSIPQKTALTLKKLSPTPNKNRAIPDTPIPSRAKALKTGISVEPSPNSASVPKNVLKPQESKQAKQTSKSEDLNEIWNENKLQMAFPIGQSDITDIAIHKLDAIFDVLKEEKASRVQLLAYAQAPSGNESRARRLSLARALSVRSYLIKKGLTTTRIDVRALGSRVKTGRKDRVDVVLVSQ